MSKPSSSPAETKPNGPAPKKPPRAPTQDATRETLESIAFAFVLALLFRTFVAEAFVIPTGSMAPTLFGRNKDVVCTECRYKYQVGASEELNEEGYLVGRIEGSVCPNCRHLNTIRDLPVFKGDRILVNKFPYQIGDPERWDVIVFRYPEDPQKNYIKRLVGLPGETIRIARGDVYARQGEQGEFQILRKRNPNKQKVLQQLVYDDQYPPVDLLAKGWPERWNPMRRSGADTQSSLDGWSGDESSWKRDTANRSFSIGAAEGMKWVRYQHLLADKEDWNASTDTHQPRPQLITDFCGYNAYTRGREADPDDGRFWVGDLTLNCTVEITEVKGSQPRLTFELVEGVRKYRCEIDVATGSAKLLRNDDLAAGSDAVNVEMASASTPVRGPGKYAITFANVDDRLCLWVNGGWISSGLIPFGEGAEFLAPADPRPQPADLTPVGFAVQDVGARVSRLLLQRDIYYRAEGVSNSGYGRPDPELPEILQMDERLYDPIQYGDTYSKNAREIVFQALGSDEFFVMGDNSPRSADSRIWPNTRHAVNRHAVPRQALLGKAFFIYWPHGIPFLNNGRGFPLLNHSVYRDHRGEPVIETYPEYVFPFYPQWWRWKRIH